MCTSLRTCRVQDPEAQAGAPPQVGVEDDDVDALPVAAMVADGTAPHHALGDPVDGGVVGVGLQQERRPVELHRRVVLPGGEHGVLLVRRHLERRPGAGAGVGDGGLQQAHHGRELATPQRVAHVQHPLVAQRLQHPDGVERRQRAVVRLPPPPLVRRVRPPPRLAGQLRMDVGTRLLAVQRVLGVVTHPGSREHVALLVLVLVVQRERKPPLPLPLRRRGNL